MLDNFNYAHPGTQRIKPDEQKTLRLANRMLITPLTRGGKNLSSRKRQSCNGQSGFKERV
jgi:hypothetical protein